MRIFLGVHSQVFVSSWCFTHFRNADISIKHIQRTVQNRRCDHWVDVLYWFNNLVVFRKQKTR